jgi:HK97 family phage prohead protease
MSGLDFLRKDILAGRLKGIAGGNRIMWSTKQAALLTDYIMSAPESMLRRAVRARSPAPASMSPSFAVLRRSAESSTSLTWAFKLTDESVDMQNDVIKVDGWDLSNCLRNLPALYNHESDQPVGQWSMPVKTGSALLATAMFPEKGISATSDQVRGMVAAGMLRGCSVGFVPGRFEFSKDPQRPMGINFLSGHRLIEASICAVPANPGCLVIGPTSAKSLDEHVIAARQHETRSLISLVKTGGASRSAPLTREQRLAEVARLRRLVDAR